jgi:hypothetical protein
MVKRFWILAQLKGTKKTGKNFIQALFRISPAFCVDVNISAVIILSTTI